MTKNVSRFSKYKYIVAASFVLLLAVFAFLPHIKHLYYSSLTYEMLPIKKMAEDNRFSNTNTNIILITIDTLRADHLGCYGHKTIDTPNIDKMAEEGILFENAFTAAPITGVSHASIFTGLYPYKHGVRDNGDFYFDDKNETLAEIMKKNGYVTAAFPSVFLLQSKLKFNQGFDDFDENVFQQKTDEAKQKSFKGVEINHLERYGDEVTFNFLKWLFANKNKKFFAWIHYFDPHDKYSPPTKYRKQKKYNGSKTNLYDGEIAFVDECIGYIIKYINSLETDNNTLVVITADHGESLGERKNYWGHIKYLYDDVLKVPLIFYLPSKLPKKKRIKNLVRTIDIMPTILDLLKIESPQNIQGKSLRPFIEGADRKPAFTALSETLTSYIRKGGMQKYSLRTLDWKIIKYLKYPDEFTNIELYNLKNDPQEKSNLASRLKQFPEVDLLMEKLDKFISQSKKVDKKVVKVIDEAAKNKLRALGYLQ